MLKHWDGTVLSVGRQTFWARLYEQDQPDLEAEIRIRALPKSERPYLHVGAIFIWDVTVKSNRIRFSRRTWTASEIRQIQKRAKQLFDWLS